MFRKVYEQIVPSYISPSEFWELSLSEIEPILQNIAQKNWDMQYILLSSNRVLAGDMSRILAGTDFVSLENFLSPNPRSRRVRTDEEIERTLLYWSKLPTRFDEEE